MSCFAIAYRRTVAAAIPLTVLLGLAGTTLSDSAARAAEARPTAAAPARCGELPRGSRAYKDCITAQARRDTKPDAQAPIKPVFSSR